jgi:DNA invertase Pin-like site-specific DNA recombinase
VSGADPIDQRPGLTAALAHIAGNGVKTIIVESASRFARDLITQETAWRFLRDMGISVRILQELAAMKLTGERLVDLAAGEVEAGEVTIVRKAVGFKLIGR